jgi:hypothetical protein
LQFHELKPAQIKRKAAEASEAVKIRESEVLGEKALERDKMNKKKLLLILLHRQQVIHHYNL